MGEFGNVRPSGIDPENEETGDYDHEVAARKEEQVCVGRVLQPLPSVEEHVDDVGEDAEDGKDGKGKDDRQVVGPESIGMVPETSLRLPFIKRRVVVSLNVGAQAFCRVLAAFPLQNHDAERSEKSMKSSTKGE